MVGIGSRAEKRLCRQRGVRLFLEQGTLPEKLVLGRRGRAAGWALVLHEAGPGSAPGTKYPQASLGVAPKSGISRGPGSGVAELRGR